MTILLRIFLVLAGLVFAGSLAIAAVLMLALWGVRAAWAKLTGRPVTPFIIRIDPRGGFNRMYRRADHAAPTARGAAGNPRRDLADVTDVEAKPPAGGG